MSSKSSVTVADATGEKATEENVPHMTKEESGAESAGRELEPVKTNTSAQMVADMSAQAGEKEIGLEGQITTQAPPSNTDPSSYPEGGLQAWLAVLGGFCCLVCTFGWINATGIFQTYYQSDLLSSYDPSTIAWILSLETFFMFFCGPFIGYIYDNYGPRQLLFFGSLLHVFGIMMISISTEYYQILLSQGVCSPLGASAIFYAAMSSVTTWFHRRRALALGIMASGSSLGGVIFPILIQQLIPRATFPWAMRTAGFLILFLLTIANLTVRSRIPPTPRPFHPKIFILPLLEIPFALLVVSSFLIFFGIFIPFNFITLSAVTPKIHTAASLAPYMLPILNATSIFGRILPGYAADRLGRFNVVLAMCLLSGVIILALWLPAASPVPLIVFAILYGFGSGAFVSMVPALVAQISDIRQIGVRTGTVFAVVSLGALTGNPIAGALLGDEGEAGWRNLKIFAGALVVCGTGLMAVTRMVVAKGVVKMKI